MSEFIFWTAIGFVAATIYASFFEWILHRYIMHRPLWKFRYPFERHALIHHHVFKADETYHLIDEKDAETIPMAWWNGPVLVLVGSIPFLILSWITGHWGFLAGGGL